MDPTISTKILGDVLSDTWHIYKNSFWKIVAISAVVQIPAGILLAVMAVILAVTGIASGLIGDSGTFTALSGSFIVIMFVVVVVAVVAFALMAVILEGAITHAACQQYVWKQVESSLAFRRTFRRIWSMLGAIVIA